MIVSFMNRQIFDVEALSMEGLGFNRFRDLLVRPASETRSVKPIVIDFI